MFEVFWRFLLLGLTSFGGPAAHLGYFQRLFVDKLNWLSTDHYSRLIALSQLLPGPGSSQVGFAIGLHRAGLLGAVTAFIAFTLPSFILLYALAIGLHETQNPYWPGIVHGLKLLAVIVVMDAILTMWHNFCNERLTRFLAIATTAALLIFPSFYTQLILLLSTTIIGSLYLEHSEQNEPTSSSTLALSSKAKWWLSITFALFILSLIPWNNTLIELFARFYQAGSLVFGGGHVVLPLLQQTVSGQLSEESFLTAYAAAQAVPGPMFTLSAFLGAELMPSSPFTGALIATLAIFLPGFLLVLGLSQQWNIIAEHSRFSGAIIAVNASVVGFLLATFISPIAPSALSHWLDVFIALLGFVLLRKYALSVFWLILFFTVYGILFKQFL